MTASEGSSETSYWINFFINSGIPPSDSAQYAVVFVDNRIDHTMLMDLNKEYLNDVGITRLGDVIAILKNAKDVHKKMVEEQVLKGRHKVVVKPPTTAAPSTQAPLIKRESPLSRAVGHCLAGQRSASPIVPPSQVTVGSRLGPEKGGAGVKGRRNILVPGTAPPAAPPPPGQPTQSSIATSKKTVFARLGDTKTAMSPDAGANEATINAKVQPLPDSVFRRLGGKKRVSGGSVPDDAGSESDGEPLPYAGVLISPPKKLKASPAPASTQALVAHKAGLTSPAPHSSNSEGIFGKGTGIPKRLKDRLGKVVSPADTTQSGAPVRTNLKITAKNRALPKKSTVSARTDVKARLEVAQSEVSSSSDQRPCVLSRLGKQH